MFYSLCVVLYQTVLACCFAQVATPTTPYFTGLRAIKCWAEDYTGGWTSTQALK